MHVKISGSHEKNTTTTSDYNEDFNQMWNVMYKLQAAVEPIMPSSRATDRACPKAETDSCPSGHMLVQCDGSDMYYCKQCSEMTFQPNENWFTDKCRLRQQCIKPNMKYSDPGSPVRDATCACKEGYHFPNEDQRACVPNKICPKGTAHGTYGNCEPCLRKSMYSDTVSRNKKCKPLTNCEKQSRCTLVKSNGETDNVCGPVVKGLNACENIKISFPSNSTTLTIAIVGGILAALMLLIIVLVFVFFLRRQQLRQQFSQKVLTDVEMEELQQRIIKECDRDAGFSRKVMSTTCSFIEERIDRQIWGLAQELFRTSTKQGHFEQIVEKYKDSQAKYTVNGYLHEWKLWKGENKEAVAELFRCLRHLKRDDIVNEICLCMRNDVGYNASAACREDYSRSKLSLKDECLFIFFPCFVKKKEKSAASPTAIVEVGPEAGEAGTKLLAIATDDLDHDDSPEDNDTPGTFFRSHPSPSAPVIEDVNSVFPSVMDNVKYSRQFSQPVQATS